jgi:hypothetical protein
MSRYAYEFDVNAISGIFLGPVGSCTNLNVIVQANGSVFFPDASGTAVLNTFTQTLTNKTITSATDNVTANQLLAAGGTFINFIGAPTPTAGQVLQINANALSATFGTANLAGSTILADTSNVAAVGNFLIRDIIIPDNTTIHVQTSVLSRYTAAGGASLNGLLTGGFRRGVGNASIVRVGNLPTDVLYITDNIANNQLQAFLSPNTSDGAVSVIINPLSANASTWKLLTSYVVATSP